MGGDLHNRTSGQFRICHRDLREKNSTLLQKEQPFDKQSLISSIKLPFSRSTPELQQPIASSS